MFELTKSLFKEFAESAIRLARKLSVSRCIKGRHEQEYYGLCEDGYFILPEFLSRDVCKEMISDIDMYIDKETDRINIWSDEVGADRRVYFVESINDRFNRFYEEPYFREVLASYTGITEPKGFVLAARIDAVNGNMGAGGGWHRDSPVHHQTKAMCYLSDVHQNNGPFQYISKSHSKKSVISAYLKGIFRPGQYRFTNDDVEHYLDKTGQDIVEMTAGAGTLVFADTKGIHRGKPIAEGRRYVLFCYFWDKKIPDQFEALRQLV